MKHRGSMSIILFLAVSLLTLTCLIILPISLLFAKPATEKSNTVIASWYSLASCKREGTSGIMANGRKLDDEAFTAASWDYPLGTQLRVCRTPPATRLDQQLVLQATPCIQVRLEDRGPAKRLVRQGRRLDLSKASFQAVCGDLRQGVCEVEIIEVIP